MVKGEWQMERKFTYATSRAVGRFMERHRISELIYGGIVANDRLSASGCFVARDSQGLMNFSGTCEPTQEKRSLRVSSVENDLCEATTCQSM
jgi:hypothetical protein